MLVTNVFGTPWPTRHTICFNGVDQFVEADGAGAGILAGPILREEDRTDVLIRIIKHMFCGVNRKTEDLG